MLMMKAKQQGFSLLEIMIVILIMGIMGAVIVGSLTGNVDKANQTKAKTDIKTLEGYLKMYKAENHKYPTMDQGLQALVSKPNSPPIPKNYPKDGYIQQLEKDPWDNDYQYVYPGQHGTFDVFSLGADGELGGEGENADIGNWNSDEDNF